MHPFTIATGTMDFAQNIFIRVHTDAGYYGVGECSAFPMIVGETQATCFEMAKDFAATWKEKDASNIAERMSELHAFTAFNATIKSAFDMALYDLAAKQQDLLDSRKSHRAGELVNPRVLGTIRKEIARLHTAIRAAEQATKESK